MGTRNYQLLAAGLAVAACCFAVRAEPPPGPVSGTSAVAGSAAAPAATPGQPGSALAAVGVAGLGITWFDANSWNYPAGPSPALPPRPQRQYYYLTLAGKFAEPVNKILGGQLEKVVADSGETLFEGTFYPNMQQRYENGKLQAGGAFSTRLDLRAPGAKATAIKELSGKITYTAVGKGKMVNLGLTEFAVGARGTALDAVIDSLDETPRKNGTILNITLSGPLELFGDFKFYDADGSPLTVKQSGFSRTSNNSRTFVIRCEGRLPAKGRIEVEVLDKLEAAFKLKNVPLFGRPDLTCFAAEAETPAARSDVAAEVTTAAQPVVETGKNGPETKAIEAGEYQEGQGLSEIAVTGFEVTWFDVNEWNKNPVPQQPRRTSRRPNLQGSHYLLNVVGRFAEPVYKLVGGTVDKAVTDSGEDLADHNSDSVNLSLLQNWANGRPQAGNTFQGNFSLAVPGARALTIKELSGQLFYLARAKSGKMVNLGLAEFKTGATGTALGAKIKSLTRPGGSQWTLKLTLGKTPDEVGVFKFYGADGKELEVYPLNRPEGRAAEFEFYTHDQFPAKGRIEVEFFDEVKKLTAPFKLENVPLYGRATKPGV